MKTWLVGAAIAMALAGCGGGDAEGTDGGGEGVDAGGRADAGPRADEDAGGGAEDDGGATVDDGGVSEDDGGVSADDGGASSDDGGVSVEDGGASVDDGGASVLDSGISRRDAGPLLDGGALAGCGRCNRDEYCATPAGMCDVAGTCTARPEGCLAVFMPVCGCDGMTYSNACEARAAGQSVASEGACPAVPDCRTEGCARGEHCEPCRGAGYVCLPAGIVC